MSNLLLLRGFLAIGGCDTSVGHSQYRLALSYVSRDTPIAWKHSLMRPRLLPVGAQQQSALRVGERYRTSSKMESRMPSYTIAGALGVHIRLSIRVQLFPVVGLSCVL